MWQQQSKKNIQNFNLIEIKSPEVAQRRNKAAEKMGQQEVMIMRSLIKSLFCVSGGDFRNEKFYIKNF